MNVLTAFVRVHEASDTCAQNSKKGGSVEHKEPPGSATSLCHNVSLIGIIMNSLSLTVM